MDHLGLTHRARTVRLAYGAVCAAIRDHGARGLEPRGQRIRELRAFTLIVEDPTTDAMPHGMGRNLSPAIGAAEALTLIGGVSDPALMARITPNFRRFMDGGNLAGAYGPRVRWQWPEVQRRLESDEHSRQAVVTIFDPAYDLYGEARDVPCTLTLQFFLRDAELELHVSMRSNDVWWGLAYDAFMFTQAQVALADAIGVEPGHYVHRVGSMHLYERDVAASEALALQGGTDPLAPALRLGAGNVERHQALARAILGDQDVEDTPPEADWYHSTLAQYVVPRL